MRKDITFGIHRYKFVYLTCEHLYYDIEIKMYCCALKGKKYKTLNPCKQCRMGNLEPILREHEAFGVHPDA